MIDLFILLTVLTGIFLALGWLLGGLVGIGLALVLAVCINFLSYWYSDRVILKMFNAMPTKHIQMQKMVERLSREASIPVPKLYLIPTKPDILNAFATGRDPRHSAIAVTRGLLTLEDEELEAVLAHEIGHIRNRDTLVSTIAATLAGAISYLAQIGYWSVFMGSRRDQGSIFGLLLIVIFAPMAALIIRLAVSRSREYGADYMGVLLTKKPKALVSALTKISHASREHTLHGPTATSHLWIVNPFHKDWFTGLFSTHPPIKDRIERINEINKIHF